jgi:hypothetical protein
VDEDTTDPGEVFDLDIGYHRLHAYATFPTGYVSSSKSGPWQGIINLVAGSDSPPVQVSAQASGFIRYVRARLMAAPSVGGASVSLYFD